MFIPPLDDKKNRIRSVAYFWSLAQMILVISLEFANVALLLKLNSNYLWALPDTSPAHDNVDALVVYMGLYMFGLVFQFLLFVDAVGFQVFQIRYARRRADPATSNHRTFLNHLFNF